MGGRDPLDRPPVALPEGLRARPRGGGAAALGLRRETGRGARALRAGDRRLGPRQASDASPGAPPPRRALPAVRDPDRGGALQGLRDVLLPPGADRRACPEGPPPVEAAQVKSPYC